MTYGDLIDRLVELGIAPPTRRTEHAALLDEEVEDGYLEIALTDVGVAVHVDPLDGREVSSAYLDVIRDAVTLRGDAAEVTDVAVDREAVTDQLSFRINGRPVTWWMDAHGPGDWIYSFSAIWGQMHTLAPDDPRDFYTADCADPLDGSIYVLLTRKQADALREELGLDLDPVPFTPDRPH